MSHTLSTIALISRLSSAGIWLYQGLVPKLLGPHADEIAMASAFGIPATAQVFVSRSVGMLEVVFGVCLFATRSRPWPHLLSAVASAILLAFVALYAPTYLVAAFNPVALNAALFALSVIAALAVHAHAQSAA